MNGKTPDTTLDGTQTLWVIGLNHRTAPVHIREKLHYDASRVKHALHQLVEDAILTEALILSTCNRVEIYGIAPTEISPPVALSAFLAQTHDLAIDDLAPHLYHHCGLSAIHHGFRVAASLDSLVLGEPQITGQAKDAYRLALESETLGFHLSKFWNRAFFVSKKVRTETRIGAGAVSVGYAACELGRQIFGSLAGKTVLLMGAGEIGERIVEHLTCQEIGGLWIGNRNLERANALQTRFGGDVIPLSDCIDKLDDVDIVMSSLGIETYFWRKDDLAARLKPRNRPLFMIDVSVPRSLDPGLSEIENVYLYNIDDLQAAIARNTGGREEEARKATRIVEACAQAYYQEVYCNDIAPTISQLSQKLHEIKQHELDKTFRKHPDILPEMQEAVTRCASAIVNKILHAPILQLKTHHADDAQATPAEGSRVKHLIETLSALFNLD